MRVARAILATLGLGCLLVAFAGKGKIGIPEYLVFDVAAVDTPGRIGLAATGVGIFVAIAVHWWMQRDGAVAPQRTVRLPNPAPDLAPARRPMPLVSVPPEVVTVHYHRPDGRYDDWRLYYAGDGVAEDDRVQWPGRRWDGVDGYGALWRFTVADPAIPVSIDVHRGKLKDPYGPLIMDPTIDDAIYLASGRPGFYPTAAAALATPLQERELVLHYHRPRDDYEGWTLWCWDGPADPPLHWEESLHPQPYRDDFGIVFRVPLAAGATGLKVILHNEDVKDHLPNGLEIKVDIDGLEIFVEQGKVGKLRPAPH